MSEQPPAAAEADASTMVSLVIQPAARQPLVTYIVIGLTVLVYVAQVISGQLTGYDLPAAYGAKVNEYILAGQLWRLITPVLLHGSITHIFFNMYALYSIGTGLEQHYGHGRFTIIYLLAGFAGNLFSFWFSAKPSLGASTAIFGLIAAEAVFVYQNRFIFGERSGKILGNLILIIVINLGFGLLPNIDNWGHLGGLLGGFGFAWFAGTRYRIRSLQGYAPDGTPLLTAEDGRNTQDISLVTAVESTVLAGLTLIRFLRP